MWINKETGVSDRNAALLSGHSGKQRRRKWDTSRGIEEERRKIEEMKEGRREIKEEIHRDNR
jgi:hypothetical protein